MNALCNQSPFEFGIHDVAVSVKVSHLKVNKVGDALSHITGLAENKLEMALSAVHCVVAGAE